MKALSQSTMPSLFTILVVLVIIIIGFSETIVNSNILRPPPDPQKEKAIERLVVGLPASYTAQAAQALQSYPTWFLLKIKDIIWTNNTLGGNLGSYYVNQSTIAVDYLAPRGLAALVSHELGHMIYYEVLTATNRQFLDKETNLTALEAGIPGLVVTPTDDEAFAYLNENYRLGVLNSILSQNLYLGESICFPYTIVRPVLGNQTYTTATTACVTMPGYMYPNVAPLNRPFFDSVAAFLLVLNEYGLST